MYNAPEKHFWTQIEQPIQRAGSVTGTFFESSSMAR
jgi:hypothetical protein